MLLTDESPAVTAFLTLLSQWDKPEIEETLCQRVEFSKRAIGKLLQVIDMYIIYKRRVHYIMYLCENN
jgi:E3 ubiquitin-protein ligase BRE1